MGLFKALNRQNAVSADELAKECGADPVLAGRLLRCLASHGAVEEKGPDSFGPAMVSKTFAEPRNEAAIETCFDFLAPGWIALPSFLQEKAWQNSTSQTDTPLAKGHHRASGAAVWDILLASPQLNAFNTYMSTFNEGHKDWTEFYPVLGRLGDGARDDADAVMMVDVGGGLGHQAINLKAKYPGLPGKFIVQDLPQAFPEPRPEGVEYMAHDFTTPQPVQGARLYYMRYVPHDWSQEFNINLCIQLRKAMKPGYSRLIVNEWILPEMGATRFMTCQDLNMLNACGGMERTLRLHREYLEAAGLRITKVYNPDDQISEAVIEAEVA